MIGDALRQLDRGGVGQRAGGYFRQGKGRMLRCVYQVSRQHQFETATDRHAADRGDNGFVQPAQLLQAGKTADTVVTVDRVAVGGCFQIPTGAEELFAGGANDGHA